MMECNWEKHVAMATQLASGQDWAASTCDANGKMSSPHCGRFPSYLAKGAWMKSGLVTLVQIWCFELRIDRFINSDHLRRPYLDKKKTLPVIGNGSFSVQRQYSVKVNRRRDVGSDITRRPKILRKRLWGFIAQHFNSSDPSVLIDLSWENCQEPCGNMRSWERARPILTSLKAWDLFFSVGF